MLSASFTFTLAGLAEAEVSAFGASLEGFESDPAVPGRSETGGTSAGLTAATTAAILASMVAAFIVLPIAELDELAAAADRAASSASSSETRWLALWAWW